MSLNIEKSLGINLLMVIDMIVDKYQIIYALLFDEYTSTYNLTLLFAMEDCFT